MNGLVIRLVETCHFLGNILAKNRILPMDIFHAEVYPIGKDMGDVFHGLISLWKRRKRFEKNHH